MTFTMTIKIEFPRNENRPETIIFNRVGELEYESSRGESSLGSLTFPRSLIKLKNKNLPNRQLYEIIKSGDEIIISFGYNGNNVKEFTGYVSEVSADSMGHSTFIKFEDEMFKVRKIPVNFLSSNTTLRNLLAKLFPNYEIDCLDVQLGAVKLAKTQGGAVLAKLKSDWGLSTYMYGKTIVCGKFYDVERGANPVIFHLERNCVSASLNFKRKEDIRLKIKVVSTLRNNTKITVDNIGDKDGNERQLTFYNIEVKAELERLGKLEYEKYKQDRFDGSFTAFGIPSVMVGMKAEIKSAIHPDRLGTYYIDRVRKSFNSNGIRQEITIGNKV